MKEITDILKQICPIYGPSGREDKIILAIETMVKPFADEIYRDAMGSLLALKKGKDSSKKLMFAAHADEIGLVVTRIDDRGFIYFTTVGGVTVKDKMGGARVQFENGTIGIVQKTEALKNNSVLESDLFIDVGVTNREAALALVQVGDFATFVGETFLQGNFIVSKALDNRSGCAVAIQAFQSLKTPQYDTWFVWSTQEEVGTRGATTAAYQINPTWGFAIDTTLVGDNPQEYPVAMACGEGVAIKARDRSIIVPKKLVDFVINIADKAKIKWQMEVLPFGGTDAGAIQLTRDGVVAGTLSIPTRYVHSPSEMIHLDDLKATTDLVVALCNEKFDF